MYKTTTEQRFGKRLWVYGACGCILIIIFMFLQFAVDLATLVASAIIILLKNLFGFFN